LVSAHRVRRHVTDHFVGDNLYMSKAEFQDLREALRSLSLHEVDFSVDDAFVSHIGDVKRAVTALDTTAEPWVAEWASAEHVKGGMLWTAAKTNWSRQQSAGSDRTFNERARAHIIDRFNAWVAEFRRRLDDYENSDRSAVDVAEWRHNLDLFRKDPVRNP
jgi:hypothetical protein